MSDIAYFKVAGGTACNKKIMKKEGLSLRQLYPNELDVANQARDLAIRVLKHLLKNPQDMLFKTSTINGHPDFKPRRLGTCFENTPYKEYHYAIVSSELVQQLVDTLLDVRFIMDDGADYSEVFAYVYPDDNTHTVYLCGNFWNAPAVLQKDSQPGTLIHEVSHFLGTEDVDYAEKHVCVGFEKQGAYMPSVDPWGGSAGPLKLNPVSVSCTSGDGKALAFKNANSIEYEFEIFLAHEKPYMNGRYECCGNVAMDSLCTRNIMGRTEKNLAEARNLCTLL